MTIRTMQICISAVLLAAVQFAYAQSGIDPDHKFAWAENVGWTNWQHDRPNSEDGVRISDTFLAGFVWAENVGWMNLGDGSPANGVHYANNDGSDFGVNIDSLSQELFGVAWGENIGWINLEGGALADPPNPARIGGDCRLHGFAWSENVGWINLDHDGHFVGLTPLACFGPGDVNCDGSIDLVDVAPFITALLNPDEYENQHPDCDINTADANEDGSVDLSDIEAFIELLLG